MKRAIKSALKDPDPNIKFSEWQNPCGPGYSKPISHTAIRLRDHVYCPSEQQSPRVYYNAHLVRVRIQPNKFDHHDPHQGLQIPS